MRKVVALIIIFLSAALLRAQNVDGSRYKLAVYVTVTGIQDEQSVKNIKAIAQGTASNALIGSGKYEMIERSGEFLQQIEAEQKYQMSGDVRDDQISQIGASYGAQKVCVVGITISGSYLYVAARIVDVVTKTSSESGEADNDSYSSVAKIRPTVSEAISQILVEDNYHTSNGIISITSKTSANADKEFSVSGVTFKMVFVKGGTFQMGNPSGDKDEKPVHSVTLSDFYIGEFEVTQALWQEIMSTTVYQQRDKANTSWSMRGVGADYPIYYVNHSEAKEFCRRLNQRLRGQLPSGYSFALPTEAEWEYAARGGGKSYAYTYSGSNYLSDVGWYSEVSNESTHPVGSKKANELGLYDMSGNVSEWCEDWHGTYSLSSQTNPTGPSSGLFRMLRGGSWDDGESECRVSCRNGNNPEGRNNYYGFRLALVRR